VRLVPARRPGDCPAVRSATRGHRGVPSVLPVTRCAGSQHEVSRFVREVASGSISTPSRSRGCACRFAPLTEDGVVHYLVEGAARTEDHLRGRSTGHPSTHPERHGRRMVSPLRAIGRPVASVCTRPLSAPRVGAPGVRAAGRPEYYDQVDTRALAREVGDPWGPGGTGATSRRCGKRTSTVPPGGPTPRPKPVRYCCWTERCCSAGGSTLNSSCTWRCRPATLARRTAARDAWTLAGYARYAVEVAPTQMLTSCSVDDAAIRRRVPRLSPGRAG